MSEHRCWGYGTLRDGVLRPIVATGEVGAFHLCSCGQHWQAQIKWDGFRDHVVWIPVAAKHARRSARRAEKRAKR